jgi:hypothetical protein
LADSARPFDRYKQPEIGPQQSYRWNFYPFAIHLFYEPKQQAQGPFSVQRGWDTLALQPLGSYAAAAAAVDLHQMPDPTPTFSQFLPIACYCCGHSTVGVLEEMKLQRTPNPSLERTRFARRSVLSC